MYLFFTFRFISLENYLILTQAAMAEREFNELKEFQNRKNRKVNKSPFNELENIYYNFIFKTANRKENQLILFCTLLRPIAKELKIIKMKKN